MSEETTAYHFDEGQPGKEPDKSRGQILIDRFMETNGNSIIYFSQLAQVLDKKFAELETTEREQCCKDVCWMCDEKPTRPILKSGEYWHKEGSWFTQCHATNIRQRWAKEHQIPQ